MKSLLRHLREESGLGQATLAAAVGVSQTHVSDVETGRRAMTPAFALKAGPAVGADAFALLCAGEFEQVAKAAEGGDPAAPNMALGLAKRLMELVKEPGALDEEQSDAVREIVSQLISIIEAKPPATPRVPTGEKPVAPIKPAAKASSTDGTNLSMLRRLGGMSRSGGMTADEAYDRLEAAGLQPEQLARLLDEVSTKLSSSRLNASQRRYLQAMYDAILRRINDLGGDGARPTDQELVADRVAATKAAASEAQAQRAHAESMRALDLDAFGRPLDPVRREHERTLKSSEYDLTQDEIETGLSDRGLPLAGKELDRRRRF